MRILHDEKSFSAVRSQVLSFTPPAFRPVSSSRPRDSSGPWLCPFPFQECRLRPRLVESVAALKLIPVEGPWGDVVYDAFGERLGFCSKLPNALLR